MASNCPGVVDGTKYTEKFVEIIHGVFTTK